MSSRPAETMQGLAKGLAIIEGFGADRPAMTVADAARVSGTTRPAARRCLLTLVGLGYLEFDGKFFRPTSRMMRLGGRYLETASLPQVAMPILGALRDELKESTSLAVLESEESLFVARQEVQRLVSIGIRVGRRLPLYVSATGRALLIAWSDSAILDYVDRAEPKAFTSLTATTPAAILAQVREARRTGIAVSDEEFELGVRSIAAPVYDSRGDLVAAISVSAASARVTMADMIRDNGPPLLRAAKAIGDRL